MGSSTNWVAVQTLQTLQELVDAGHTFLICSNLSLPFPDDSVDTAIANYVPHDRCEPLPSAKRFVLIGVAVWSGYDLNLLDLLNDALSTESFADLRAYAFYADSIRSADEFEAVFPGVGFVHHTPAVGYWNAGVLQETGCGYSGRQIVARLFGLDKLLVHKSASAVPISR